MTLIRFVPKPATGQKMGINQRLRLATCAEVACSLFLEGKTFEVDFPNGKKFIHHKAGDECGPRCSNDVCPCVNNGFTPGAGGYPHHVVDDRFDPTWLADGSKVVLSEFVDRVGEGVYAIQHVRTRGV